MKPAVEENTIAVHLLQKLPFQPPNGEIAGDADESENANEVEAELARHKAQVERACHADRVRQGKDFGDGPKD
jgi:hypothetical protein